MDRRRLVAPRQSGAVLIEPSPAEIRAALSAFIGFEPSTAPLLNTSVGAVRAALRESLDLRAPVIATGHQVEMFHAGVFAKTIAADLLAQALSGESVFFAVDADLPKSTRLAIARESQGRLEPVHLAIPSFDAQLPIENQPPADPDLWRAFFRELSAVSPDRLETLLEPFAAEWLETSAGPVDVRRAFLRGHANSERALGLRPARPVLVSDLCATPAFRVFAAHVLLCSREFATVYNEAQATYRKRHKVRGPQRPVPRLAIDGTVVELPFWIFRSGAPRQRLAVESRGDELLLLAGRETVAEMEAGKLREASFHGDPWPLERDGWQIRPRALTLTAFLRLFVSDLFIHGIGGAKYDEMTEEFSRRFFHAELSPACCVTASLHLALPGAAAAPDVAAIRARIRDARRNPQRQIPDLPPALLSRQAELIAQTRELQRAGRDRSGERRRVHEALAAVRGQLVEAGIATLERWERELQSAVELSEDAKLRNDREYFFVLHRKADLQQLVRGIEAALQHDFAVSTGS